MKKIRKRRLNSQHPSASVLNIIFHRRLCIVHYCYRYCFCFVLFCFCFLFCLFICLFVCFCFSFIILLYCTFYVVVMILSQPKALCSNFSFLCTKLCMDLIILTVQKKKIKRRKAGNFSTLL